MKQFAASWLLAFVCLAVPVSRARAGEAVDPAWFPLRAGAEWMYEVHRDQTYRPDQASISRLFHIGRTRRVAESAPDRVPGGFLVRETTVLQPLEGGEKETTSEWTVFSFAGELRIHASGETRADGTQGEVAYEQPLRLLPTTKVGESWNAGTFRNGGQSTALRGQVLGIEDVSGPPLWPGCLKVQLKGSISGTMSGTKGATEIESGEFERLLWFARGVGIVREVTTLTLDLRLPDDKHAHTVQVLTLRLLEHRDSQ